MATSIVSTAWEDETSRLHADLVGLVDRTGETANALRASGMTPDAVRSMLDNLLQGQSVMLAPNEIMAVVGLAFVVSAFVIWLAPKGTREGGHDAGGAVMHTDEINRTCIGQSVCDR